MNASTWQFFQAYGRLLRLDKPVGTFLLWWPTLWALWLAAGGVPAMDLLWRFSCGVWLMRAAGCVINDYWDRDLDGGVHRTANRPLATGQLSTRSAWSAGGVLLTLAACLVWPLGWSVVLTSMVGLALAVIYPLMKRVTHGPQWVLGLAFNWGVPLSYLATLGTVPPSGWALYAITVLWTVMYDTQYAMVDRIDDERVGIKSTAVWLQHHDRWCIAVLQAVLIGALWALGCHHSLAGWYGAALGCVAGLFLYQQHLIRHREPTACLQAFKNNTWVGLVVWLGIVSGGA